MTNKLLVVVDMQNDFIDGPLGTREARDILPRVCEKIIDWDGDIVFTMDTHDPDLYEDTIEGRELKVTHCVKDTEGHQLHEMIEDAWCARHDRPRAMEIYRKDCFGSYKLMEEIANSDYRHVELIGLCTDVCVISNAIMLRSASPYMRVIVDAECCAGVTPERHEIALEALRGCGIRVINERSYVIKARPIDEQEGTHEVSEDVEQPALECVRRGQGRDEDPDRLL